MIDIGTRFAETANQLVGTLFKLGGVNPKFGVDCVGLVYCALRLMGRDAFRPIGYGLRNVTIDQYLSFAELNGFFTFDGEQTSGDLILVRPGPAQHHLAIAFGEEKFVHAHAGLRKVVCTKLPREWPAQMRWRLAL